MCAIAFAGVLPASVHAQASVWTNGAGNSTWGAQGSTTDDLNWANNPASNPAADTNVILDNSQVSTAQTISVTGNQVIGNLQIDAPFQYTLNGGSLEFNDSLGLGSTGIIVNQTHGYTSQTINSNLKLDNFIQIQNNSAGLLTLGGNISLGANAITINGSGNLVSTGTISGPGSLYFEGTGSTTLSGSNTYSSGTLILSGTVNANSSTALGSGVVNLQYGTIGSTNSSAIANPIAIYANAGLSGINSSGTLTQTNGSFTLTMTNATQSGTLALSNTNTGETLAVNTNAGTSSTISGQITNGGTGTGNLTKTGNGTLVLSNGTGALNGGNTYTGATTLSGGTLSLGQSNTILQTSSLTMSAGTTLALNNFSQAVGTLTINGNSTLDFGSGGTNAFVFTGFTDAGGSLLTVNNYSGSNALATTTAALSTTLLNDIYFSGSGSGSVEAVTTSANDGVSSYKITPNASFFYWSATGASNNITTAGNWHGGSAPTSGAKVDFGSYTTTQVAPTLPSSVTYNAIRFDSAATSSFTITEAANTINLSGTLPSIIQQSSYAQTISGGTLALGANSVVDVSGTGALNLSSTITGAYSIEKLSAGTLNLSGANTYSGGTLINAGIVGISGNNTALGTGAVTVSNGATLQINQNLTLSNALTINGAGAVNGAIDSNAGASNTTTLKGAVTLGSSSTVSSDSGTLAIVAGVTGTGDLTVNGAGNTTISSAITTGTGALNVNTSGSGSVTLSGANTYTGATTVNSGALSLSGSSTTIQGALIQNGGTINETTSSQIGSASAVTLNSGTLNLSNGTSQTLTGNLNTFAGSTINLGTSGAGAALTLNQAGTDKLNGVVAGSGSLTTGGTGTTILVGANTYSGGTTTSSTVDITNSSSLGTGSVTVNSGGTVQTQNNITVANAFSVSGTGASSNGAIENLSGANTISGPITVAGNSRIQADLGSLTLSGAVGIGSNTLNVGGSGNTVVNAGITGASGSSLTKDGSGTLSLGVANPTFLGSIAINAGTLQTNTSGAISGNALSLASGATLNLGGTSQSVGAFTGAGALNLGSNGSFTLLGSSTLSGTLAGTGTITLNTGSTLTLGANFNDSGINIVLNGGTLKLNGTTDTFGTLDVTAGSIIDFGNPATSVLSVSSVSASAGVKLSVTGWANLVDYFYSTSDPGAQGTAPIDQIAFNGGSGASTHWNAYTSGPGSGNEITPAPEPAAYGAVLSGLALFGIAHRRRQRRR